MRIEYTIDEKLIVVRAYGFSTMDEICQVFEKIMDDPAFNYPANVLFDVRHNGHGPSTEELEALAEHLGKLEAYNDSRWAVVAHPNTLLYGISRMFCCLAESQGLCIEPFSDYDAACAWLLQSEPVA